ncbi:hypothetical protein ACHAXT_009549 [Thalassiosira profunda]
MPDNNARDNRLANARLGQTTWQCDVCHRARFRTFEEAVAHEETCDGTGTIDFDSIPMAYWSETDLREWHQRKCNEGDGWSHGFDVSYDDSGQIAKVLPYRDYAIRRKVLQFFGPENWGKMGESIRTSSALNRVELPCCGVTANYAQLLFGGDWEQSPIEWLDLEGNSIGVNGIRALLPMLRSLTKLYCLVLGHNSLGNEGARVLSDDLSQFYCVEGLLLQGNSIGDAGVMSLLADSVLETLSLWDSGPAIRRIDDRDRRLIAQCLKNKVCDESSFDSICRSNHHLCWLGIDGTWDVLNLDPVLKGLFHLNARAKRGAPIAKIIRFKLRMSYFQREFDVQPFADINVRLFPRVLELVTRSEVVVGKKERDLGGGIYYEVYTGPIIRLANIYRIVRNCHIPELYTFPSPKVEVESLKSENAALKNDISILEQKIKQLTSECDVDGSSKTSKKRSKAG